MNLDYGTLLSPVPISLPIGTLRKPTLREIAENTFDRFGYYEFLLKLDPETFYTKMCGKAGAEQWNKMSESQRENTTLFELIESNPGLQNQYSDVFRFFFVENILYKDGMFILLKDSGSEWDGNIDDVSGVISKENISQVLELMQEVCCIREVEEEKPKFKNETARKVWEKIQKGKREQKKPVDKNMSLPNLISAISNHHPSLNYQNIWDITIFQLLDAFRRMQNNLVFEIDKMRVSVWGDEKKTFDPALWYKNEYEKTN